MASESGDKMDRENPLNALPLVYYRQMRQVFRTVRKVNPAGTWARIEELRAATGLDGQGPMPDATFREYQHGWTAIGWLETRRGSGGPDESALQMLGDRITRTPEIDTLELMQQWEPTLDRLFAPMIERDLCKVPVNELEKRLEIIGVKVPRRRARFFNDFYPVYQAIKAKDAKLFLELQDTPDQAPRRVQRGRRDDDFVAEPITAAVPSEAPVGRPVVLVEPAPQPAMMLYIAIPLGSRAEYHRDGRLVISSL